MSKKKIVHALIPADVARVWRNMKRIEREQPDRYSVLLFLLEAIFQHDERAVQMSAFLSTVDKHLPWMMPSAVTIAERWIANGEGRAA